MSDDPNAFETLMAKNRRRYGSFESTQDDSGSIASTAGSSVTLPTASDTEALASTAISTRETFCYKLRCCLLEPMVFILFFAYNFSSTVLKNQIIYQTCTVIFGYNESDCHLLGTGNESAHTKDIETNVQPYAARIMMTMNLVQSLVPAFFGIFIGAWSDRYGRKPLLLVAFLGFSLQYIFCAGIAYTDTKQAVNPWYFVATVVPLAAIGGSLSFTVAAFCFIADVTTPQTRSYRMMCYQIGLYMGLMFGSFGSGYVFEATNSYTVFSISACALLGAFFVLAIFLPESLSDSNAANASGFNADAPNADDFGCDYIFGLLKDLWSTCTKPREFNDRAVIGLLMATLLISEFVADGSNAVFYLFIREQFHWSVREFTTYETISILVPAIAGCGGLLFLWLLRQCTNTSLLLLAIISLLSHAASSLMKAFAIANWQIYCAIALGVFKSLGNPMCHTIITNLVPTDERGKIFSLLAVLTSLMPFASSTAYTIIYSISISSFPGLFNFISANLYLVGIMLLLVICRKKQAHTEHYAAIFK